MYDKKEILVDSNLESSEAAKSREQTQKDLHKEDGSLRDLVKQAEGKEENSNE